MSKKSGETENLTGKEKEGRKINKINKKIKMICPDCKTSHIITDEHHGELICEKCGLVIEDKLYNFGAEHSAYDTEQRAKKERTGAPLKFSKQFKGLTTEIDRYNRDISGKMLPTERIAQMSRLRKWHKRTRLSEPGGRNLSIALSELDRMCSCLNIPKNIKEECAKLYRDAVGMGLIKGRSIESSIAAVIYLVSRKHHIPKTLKELAGASGMEKRDIGRTYNFFCKNMKIRTLPSDTRDYVHRFACNIGLSGEVETKAHALLERAQKIGETSGRSPISIAASVIYFASGMPLKEISKKIPEVGETTLRKRCKDMACELGLELNEEL